MAQILGKSFRCLQEHILKIQSLRYSGNPPVVCRSIILQIQWLRYSGTPSVVDKSARQAAAAQTTRKESPCTARAPGKPQQAKRPERKARAPQERPASRSSQTTRKESPCTARAPGKPQQPKRPERKARAPQERPASRSSPNDQEGKPVRRRSAQPNTRKKNSRFSQKSKKHVARMRPTISKKEIS